MLAGFTLAFANGAIGDKIKKLAQEKQIWRKCLAPTIFRENLMFVYRMVADLESISICFYCRAENHVSMVPVIAVL
jgi:hypothetical protein